jgi:predicted RNase H-like HicB family nuclease
MDLPISGTVNRTMAVAHGEGTEQLTILYEEAEDGWVAARIQEVPAAISQGRSREEARANVIEALRDLTHRPTPAERLAASVRERMEHVASRVAMRLRARAR